VAGFLEIIGGDAGDWRSHEKPSTFEEVAGLSSRRK
jgi:hypothetical protein